MAFLHHSTRSTVHSDQPKMMKLLGAMQNDEMVVSTFAKHLTDYLNTVQPKPLTVRAKKNSSKLVSYANRTLPSVSPTQLKQLLTGSKTDPLMKLRNLRDQ